jgi:putative transposase
MLILSHIIQLWKSDRRCGTVCQRFEFEFENLMDFKQIMTIWKKSFNFDRIHGGLGYKSPIKFLQSIGVKIEAKWEK